MASTKKPASRRTTKGASKAKAPVKRRPAAPPLRTYDVEIDGNKLVSQLTRAGLDPTKLDLPAVVGRPRGLDITELESRLRSANTATAGDWHFHFHVGLAAKTTKQP